MSTTLKQHDHQLNVQLATAYSAPAQQSATDHIDVILFSAESIATEGTLNLPAHLSSAVVSDYLNTVLTQSQTKAKLGEALPVYQTPDASVGQLLLVGLGDKALTPANAQTLATAIYKATSTRAKSISIDVDGLDANIAENFMLALQNASYTFNEYKSKPSPIILENVTLYGASTASLTAQLAYTQAVHSGQSFTRDLANQPANICFPEYMADQALALATEFPQFLTVDVLDEAKMTDLGMFSFLAVSKGSEREGRLVTLSYCGKPDLQNTKPIVLVGKGVTFDTGGISLKPALGMDEMKYDMSGSASVLGVMRALCESAMPVHVVGAIACAENMPSGRATRPGDVVSSMQGDTIEILNTDAEGRLVLCDTLTYIKRFDPELVIDIATLTGACIVALGKVVSGLFSPDDALANDLLTAGLESHDRLWRMPILDDYQELLDSACADIANIGGPTAGAVTAACFLSRFTKDYRWAHLDIAGTSHVSGANKCATGRPVPLLMAFIRQQMATKASTANV